MESIKCSDKGQWLQVAGSVAYSCMYCIVANVLVFALGTSCGIHDFGISQGIIDVSRSAATWRTAHGGSTAIAHVLL